VSTIVYLIDQPLDERNHERFGIQAWTARGWAVEVLDLTPLVYPRVWQEFGRSGRRLSRFGGYRALTSMRELLDSCSRAREVKYCADLSGDSYYSVLARMRLIRSGAVRMVFATGSVPDLLESGAGGFARQLASVFGQGPSHSIRFFGDVLARRLAAPFTRPGLSIVAGAKSLRSSLDTGFRHEILRAHNLDYDIYLQLLGSTGVQPGEYAVFVDQNICFAPDFICENAAPYATAAEYFPALCNGLRKMSAILRAPVRVAAHPRLPAQPECRGHFQQLSVEYGKTAELISGCRFVVCHYSTAIQLAVLFDKPVIFVTTDELASSAAGNFIARFAAALGKSVINLQGDLSRIDWQAELRVDARKYDEYRREYIKTHDSPEVPHWDIVIDHVERVST
jgi:hypothetical protein